MILYIFSLWELYVLKMFKDRWRGLVVNRTTYSGYVLGKRREKLSYNALLLPTLFAEHSH
jgi:hypothetical protein